MIKHISYPKIGQFRNVVSDINKVSDFKGLDDNGSPIYESSKKPVITFFGTVKLHGTNASVCYNAKNGFWFQSRQKVITPENDNAAFAFFAESNKDSFFKIVRDIVFNYHIDLGEETISIYGEWAGKGIQKGVGVSELEKGFYIFGVKISKIYKPEDCYWINPSGLRDNQARIFNIRDYGHYRIDIDFNNPHLCQNDLVEITNKVEAECPVAKFFGAENVTGEGVVWTGYYNEKIYMFKVKGEKHSVTKVKTLANVDVEKIKSIDDFVNYSVTEGRFNQAIENVFENNDLDIRKLGDVIRWILKDILEEESDTMFKNGLEPKDVNKYLSARVKEMFLERSAE